MSPTEQQSRPPLPAPAHTFYTTEQAAAYLGITPRMVRRAREKGHLATTRLGGKRAFHTPAQLDAWVASCQTPAEANSAAIEVAR